MGSVINILANNKT